MNYKPYTTRPGDTLSHIARWAKLSLPDVIACNPQIKNPDKIYVGQTILLPASVSRTSLLTEAATENTSDEPLWLKIARREIGVTENRSNPRILEYLATVNHLPRDARQTDATAWCAAFVNWCLKTAGQSTLDSAWALDWRQWGAGLDTHRIGAVTVFSRSKTKTNGGHVGFYLGQTADAVTLLGGNQGNRVSITDYPKNGKKGSYSYKLLAYRWAIR